MWRKQTEEKPTSQVSGVPAAQPAKFDVTSNARGDAKPELKSETATPLTPAVPVAASPAAQSVAAPPSVVSAASAPVPPLIARNVPRETSRITAGLKIRGEVSGDTDLYIDGDVQGSIRLPDARVSVGPQGNVKADIEAREIVIEGAAQGTMKASQNIHLAASSRVEGSILAPRIGIDDGARLRGKVDMTPAGGAAASSRASNTEFAGTAFVAVKA